MSHPYTTVNKQSKYICFTYNNPPIEDDNHDDFVGYLQDLKDDSIIEWAIWQYEKGVEETPHYQGTICFPKKKRLREAHKILPQSHMEICVDVQKSINYCQKPDGTKEGSTRLAGPWTIGDVHPPRKNTKSDGGAWHQIRELVKKGATDLEIEEKFPMQYANNYNAIQRLRGLHHKSQPVQFRNIEVILLYGPSELGKSKYAFEQWPYAYRKNCANKWFDGYAGQETIILEDYYGSFTLHEFYNLLDGYPMLLEVKGSHVNAQWNRVVITSNRLPHEWYKNALKSGTHDTHALFRRIHNLYVFTKEDQQTKIEACDKDETLRRLNFAYQDYLLHTVPDKEDPCMYINGQIPQD